MGDYAGERARKPGESHIAWSRRVKCQAKIRYLTRFEAEEGLRRVTARYGQTDQQPYFCHYCHEYHLGRSPTARVTETDRQNEQIVRSWCPGCRLANNDHWLYNQENRLKYPVAVF